MALTRAELDSASCSDPGCECSDVLYFHGKCHPESATFTYYSNGMLVVECATCETMIAEISVAEGTDGRS